MSELFWILGATFLVSLISFVGVLTLSLRKDFLMKILLVLVAFAAGSLLGVSFFDLLPEAFELSEAAPLYILIGVLIFFIVERFIGWHHAHHEEDIDPSKPAHHHDHKKPFVYTTLVSEAVHNFLDGTIIAAGFLTDPLIGIAVTIAVALHEIPQEIGDFAILLHGGFKTGKALLYNFIVAVFAILGGVVTFFLSTSIHNLAPLLIGIAGGGFLYLALVNLLPEIHKERDWKKSLVQFVFLIIGILIIYYMGILVPHE